MTNSDSPHRRAPLHFAAARGDEFLDVLSVLLDCPRTDLNKRNSEGTLSFVRSFIHSFSLRQIYCSFSRSSVHSLMLSFIRTLLHRNHHEVVLVTFAFSFLSRDTRIPHIHTPFTHISHAYRITLSISLFLSLSLCNTHTRAHTQVRCFVASLTPCSLFSLPHSSVPSLLSSLTPLFPHSSLPSFLSSLTPLLSFLASLSLHSSPSSLSPSGLRPLHVAIESHGKPVASTSGHVDSTRVVEALITKGASLEEKVRPLGVGGGVSGGGVECAWSVGRSRGGQKWAVGNRALGGQGRGEVMERLLGARIQK